MFLPTRGTVPLALTLGASASHPPLNGGRLISTHSASGMAPAAVTQTTPAVTHTYSAPGTYAANVTVTTPDGDGHLFKDAISVQAQIQPPSAKITATPNSGACASHGQLRAGGSRDPNPNGKITQYSFNLGTEVRW